MKKLFTLFVALIATCALWASNVITYTATEKLSETTSMVKGLHTNAFDVSITNHTFADGTGTITFDGDVTSIGAHAFFYCSGLTSITIPNSVTSIGFEAFLGCTGLTSITIGNSVTSIGDRAFHGCSGLTAVHISDIVAWCGIVFGDTANPLYFAHHLYLNGAEVTDLIIPNSVTSIGIAAFEGCSGLTSITIGNSVTSIGNGAFADCSGLTSITIGNSVTSIGYSAFEGCSSLTSITIPNSVTSIGIEAFSGCSGLTSVTCEAIIPPACGYQCFNNVDKSIPLYVPAESVEAYQTAEVWKDFTNIQPIEQTALDNTIAPTDNLRKLLRDGQVLIQRGDMIYDLHGQVVE